MDNKRKLEDVFSSIEGLLQRTRMCVDCPGKPNRLAKSPDLRKPNIPHPCHNNIGTQACAANLVGTAREFQVVNKYYEEIGL